MGNVNVNGGSLEWTAVLDDGGIDQALNSLNQKLDQTARKQVQQADQAAKAQQQYAQTIISTGQAFRNLGDNIQGQFKTLNNLTGELQKVKDAQNELTKRKDLGIIGTDTANNSMAALLAKEKELSRAIEKVSQDMQTSDAIMRAASGSIVQRTLQLQQLKHEYENLSEADRNNASIGGGLLTKIQGIDAELKAVNQSFQAVEQHALGSINAKTSALAKVKSEYAALAETDRNSDIGKTMLSNIQRIEREVEVLNNSFKAVPQNAVGSLNAKVAQVSELKAKYAELSELDRKSDIGKSLAKNIKGLDKDIQKINNEFTKTNDFATKAAVAIGSYLTLSAATNFIGDIVRVRGEFQQLEVAFNTILKSKEKADKLMAEIVQLAATTPFTLQDVGAGAKQLLAYGFAADKIVGTLTMLGNVASGVGAPLNDIIYLYGTLQTQGRAYTRDIMQFTARGIPIIDELAKQFGVTKDKVQDLVEAGKVGFPEVEKAFQSLTGSGGLFFNLMQEQSKTLTGQISNLQDAWSRMLNDIGKSNEGVFSSAIAGATTLVNNYQTVLDVLKVLAITYGTYKAALILTNVAAKSLSVTTKGLTAMQILQAGASGIAQKAMAFLNKTILANPYVLAATAVAALVSAFLIFNRTASEVKTKSQLIADAQEKMSDNLSETEAKIRPYVEKLKEANVSEQERVDIYNKLAAIDPKIVEGLNAKTISYDNLTKNVNIYLDALRKQYALEASKEALQASIKQEQAIQKQITAQEKLIKSSKDANKSFSNVIGGSSFAFSSGGNEADVNVSVAQSRLNSLKDQLAEQKKISSELGQEQITTEAKKTESVKRTLKVIDDEIAAEKKAQQELSTNSKEFQDHQKKINALEEERKRIAGESKKEIAAENALETKLNSILEERKNLLQAIEGLKRDAFQSGLTKEQSELDKINEKYDNMIDKLVEFNKKTDDFNRKNNTNVQKFGLLDLASVNDTRVKELGNTALLKQGSEVFKNDLDAQRKIFEDFQQSVKEIGIEKAQEIFGEQTKGFTSFIAFLKAEADKNINRINPEKLLLINKAIVAEERKSDEELEKERLENFKRLFVETANFNVKRLAYEKQYEIDVANLKKEFSGQDLEERLKVLKEAKDQDLKNLAETIAAQTTGYRALNQKLISETKKRIKQEIDALQGQLKTPGLSQEQIQAVKDAINEWKKLQDSIDGTDDKLKKFVSDAGKIAGIFADIGHSLEGVNESLANSLQFISSMIDGISNVRSSWDKFSKERKNLKDGSGSILDTLGAGAGFIGAVAGVVTGILGIFKKAREERLQHQKEIQDFQAGVFRGELEINSLYRQRTLEIIRQNQLRLDGIRKETAELKRQQQSIQNDFNTVLAELQKEKGLDLIQVGAGFINTQFIAPIISLAGKSFDEIEQLFIKGQLTGKAKELFEQLQKLKQEGIDVDKQLLELQKQTQEIFTGTTFDSITDSIADGFKNGLHSAADFAGTFEDLMRQAMISSLKFQYLEPALKTFFDQFAQASQSDNVLTQSEIDNLKNLFNSSIADFDQKLQQFQQISGINLQSSSADSNSLKGAIKSMTEQTAELLAGQMGGLRLTAIDQLNLMRQALNVQQAIENNTALTVSEMKKMYTIFVDVTNGTKQLHIK